MSRREAVPGAAVRERVQVPAAAPPWAAEPVQAPAPPADPAPEPAGEEAGEQQAKKRRASEKRASDQDAATAVTARPGLLERVLSVRGWPIAAIMAVQVSLSLRLIWSNTAFLDEGTYLSVGHLDLAHYLHHVPMPVDFATYLSGSPMFYPPLAAVADDIGGLAGARLLSLAFILLATFLLHGVCKRLMQSRTAAFFATALFCGIAPAQFLSAFATYDAMALGLLALATWLGVRAVDERPAVRYVLLSLGGVAIMIANATKYASGLFDPVVLAVAGLAAWRAHGRKAGLDACGVMALAAAVLIVVGYDLGGASLAEGVSVTTLSRPSSTSSVGAVIAVSAQATAIVAALAVLGAILLIVRRSSRLTLAITGVLVAAEFLAPAEQARIHTTISLFKHVGYGAWFACVIAGYLLAEWAGGLSAWISRRRRRTARGTGRPTWALAVSLVGVLLAGAVGLRVADTQYQGWPNSRTMIAAFSRYVRPGGIYLVEESDVVAYYLRTKIPYQDLRSTFSLSYVDPNTGQTLYNDPAYELAIKQRYFAAVVIRFGSTGAVDELVVHAMEATKDYRMVALVPYVDAYGPGDYQIWVRLPAQHPTGMHQRHKTKHDRSAR